MTRPTRLSASPFQPADAVWVRCWRPVLAALLVAGSIWSADLTVLEPGSPAQLTALGNEALMQGRYETAIDQFKKALAIDKTAFQPTFNLALAYQQKGDLAEAKRWYDVALGLRNDHPEVLCNLGFLAFRQGDFATAVERFQDAARQAAGTPLDAADYWFNAGTARERLEQWLDARRAYDECLALNPKHAGGHYNLGTLYLGPLSDQPQALALAERHLTQATDLGGKRAEALVNLALCHERQGRGDPEQDFAAAVAAAQPASLPEVLWQRACFFDRARPPRKIAMRDDLKHLLELTPDFPGANGMLGTYAYAIADYTTAVKHLERECEVSTAAKRDAGESHYLLALIYTDHRPDPARALQHATAYYQAHPDSAKIHELRRRALRLTATVAP